jgi:molybdopterin molybdotransferase
VTRALDDGVPTRLALSDAVARVLEGRAPLGSERVPLTESVGRVLATAVVSPVDLPPWDNASMDGYAVRASDVAGASTDNPRTLHVIGEIAAGGAATIAIGEGEAVRISTGAPVPASADAVVRVEDTDRGNERVMVTDDRDVRGATRDRRNVRPRGEDVRSGQTVLEAGAAIGPAQLGVLASVGAASLDVVRRPHVAFVSSGDELVDVGRFAEVEAGERIVSSNSYTVPALARAWGATATDHGLARDDVAALGERLGAAIAGGCDVLVTSGGISVGEHDHTRAALASFGLRQHFWRVRIRPGGPFGFGTVRAPDGREIPWLGLPGNPVSAMVTFELFGRPLLRRLGGHPYLFRAAPNVTLAHDVTAVAPLTHFLRAIVTVDDEGRLVARLTGAQGSNLLTSMAAANALLVVPEHVTHAPAGSMLRAMLLDGVSDAERFVA